MYFKKLVGKKCYLSPVDVADFQKYTEWLNDLEITRNLLASSWSVTELGEKEALETLSKEHSYAIVDLKSNELIGICGLHDLSHLYRRCELGIFIGNRAFLGLGYGEDAVRELVKYAFEYLNMRNILLRVFEFNHGLFAATRKLASKKSEGDDRESSSKGRPSISFSWTFSTRI